jgi:hypothetical protein
MHQEAPIIITREDELLVHNKVLFLSTCTEIQVAILVHHMVSFYRQKKPSKLLVVLYKISVTVEIKAG